jgi:hypothetical protein
MVGKVRQGTQIDAIGLVDSDVFGTPSSPNLLSLSARNDVDRNMRN